MRKDYEFQWGEQHSMLSSQIWADGYGAYAMGQPRHTDFIVLSERKYLRTYASKTMIREWQQLSSRALSARTRQGWLNTSHRARQKYWDFYKAYAKLNLGRAHNAELFALLSQYFVIVRSIANNFGNSQDHGTHVLFENLHRELLRQYALGRLDDLITPTESDIIFEERYALSKIKKGKATETALYKHALKYAWLFFNSYDIKQNLRYLRGRLGEKVDYKEEFSKRHLLLKKQNKFFKSLGNSQVERACKYLQYLSVERLRLKDCWGGGEFRFLRLFRMIASRLKSEFAPMMASYSIEDFEQALLGGVAVPKQVMAQREKCYAWRKKGKRLELLEGKAASYIVGKFKESFGLKRQEVIARGLGASSGVARGRVRIVRTADIESVLKDLKRFRRGDILVTWMTQPNMVPIAKKAGAIVANEGGVTSHAAVIAREFGVPCVVGTKHATDIFKEGDIVEVDGVKGIVKKIKG